MENRWAVSLGNNTVQFELEEIRCFETAMNENQGITEHVLFLGPFLRTSSGYRLFIQPSTTSMEKDKVAQEEIHRIRITLVSTNVKAVEKSMLFFTCEL